MTNWTVCCTVININTLQHLNEIGVRFDEAKGKIFVLENTAVKTEKQVASLTKPVKELTDRLQDQENCGCRKNSRILGLCENVESSDAVKFMEQWIPQILDIENKSRSDTTGMGSPYTQLYHIEAAPCYDRQIPQFF